jgi:hypothetical protein
MGVKLLTKSELSSLKQKAQGRDIQEGVKIKTRVDGLRELWSKTEQDFELYKTSTLATIQKEIEAINLKKEEALAELHKIQTKCDSLMPPIVEKQKEFAQFEKSLTSWEKKLEKREEDIALSEDSSNGYLKKAEILSSKSEDNERITANLLREAIEKRKQAQAILDSAKAVQENVYLIKNEIEISLEKREDVIEEKEKELAEDDLLLMKERKDLDKEKVKVEDLKQTLLRSIERVKQGKRP